MTCIAATLKEMAADSRITGDVIHNVEKTFRHGQSIFGVAGDWDACLKFMDWIKTPKAPKPSLDAATFEAMELRSDGIYLWGSSLHPYRITGEFHAIGGGAQGAKVALHLGMTPEQAVDAVAKVCESVGGPILVLTLKGRK